MVAQFNWYGSGTHGVKWSGPAHGAISESIVYHLDDPLVLASLSTSTVKTDHGLITVLQLRGVGPGAA